MDSVVARFQGPSRGVGEGLDGFFDVVFGHLPGQDLGVRAGQGAGGQGYLPADAGRGGLATGVVELDGDGAAGIVDGDGELVVHGDLAVLVEAHHAG